MPSEVWEQGLPDLLASFAALGEDAFLARMDRLVAELSEADP